MGHSIHHRCMYDEGEISFETHPAVRSHKRSSATTVGSRVLISEWSEKHPEFLILNFPHKPTLRDLFPMLCQMWLVDACLYSFWVLVFVCMLNMRKNNVDSFSIRSALCQWNAGLHSVMDILYTAKTLSVYINLILFEFSFFFLFLGDGQVVSSPAVFVRCLVSWCACSCSVLVPTVDRML